MSARMLACLLWSTAFLPALAGCDCGDDDPPGDADGGPADTGPGMDTGAGEDAGPLPADSGPSTDSGPAVCDKGETDCDGVCADLRSDPTHCGTCEMACAAGEVC